MAIAAPQPRVLADVVAQTWVRNLVLVAGGAAFVGLAAQIAIPLPFTPATWSDPMWTDTDSTAPTQTPDRGSSSTTPATDREISTS